MRKTCCKNAMQKLVEPLKKQCDRHWEDETPEQVVAIACNGIYWRTDAAVQVERERCLRICASIRDDFDLPDGVSAAGVRKIDRIAAAIRGALSQGEQR